jgi:hypothetical protein
MLKQTIPLNSHNRSMRRLYVWMDTGGRLATSEKTLVSVVQELINKESDCQVIFDTDASVRRFADVTKLSVYQRDVLIVAAKAPWETKVISMRSLLRYGYGVGSKFNSQATLSSMYELHNGQGSSHGMSLHSLLRELDRQLIEVPCTTTGLVSDIDRTMSFMNQYMTKAGWLSTMLNATNARWAHAKNLRLTEALMELWNTIVFISGYGFDKAVTSGQGVHLQATVGSRTGWEVQNRPKRIPANTDSILVIPALGVATMVTPSAPMITDDDRVLLHLSPISEAHIVACGSGNVYDMVGQMPDIPRVDGKDYLLLLTPYLPLSFRSSSKKSEPAQEIVVPPRIKVLQAANGAA